MLFLLILVVLFIIINIKTYEKPDKIIDPQTGMEHSINDPEGQKIIRKCMTHYFDKFLRETKDDWNYILPQELHKLDKKNIFLLDVRKKEDYKKAHIKGSINIFWLNIMKHLDKLPKNKKIILICYVGHTASQTLVLLKLLGYQVQVLKFGMGVSPNQKVPIAGWMDYGYEITEL